MDSGESEGGTKPLEFWLQDLERRVAFAKPEYTVRGMFFRGMLESFRAMGDEALVRRCLEACDEERFVDLFNYPVDVQTKKIKRLTQSNGSNEHPSFSPNGRHILFTTTRGGGKNRLWLMNADGTNQRAVALDADATTPTWGPWSN